jgi:hypothetical protein
MLIIQEQYVDERRFQDFGPPSAPPIAQDGEDHRIFDAVGESSDHFLFQTHFVCIPFCLEDN